MINIAEIYKMDQSDTADRIIAVAIMASFVVLTIQYFILTFFNILGTDAGSTVQLFSKIIVAMIYLYALPVVLKRNSTIFMIIYFVAVVVFFIHYFLFPENNQQMLSIIFDLFFISMPVFIYTLSLQDFSAFKDVMRKAAIIVFVFGTLTALATVTGRASIGAYSMSLSYYMLLPAIVFLDKLIDKFNFRNLVGVIITVAAIVALGSRGAVLCIAVFILFKLIKPNAKMTAKRITVYGLLITSILFAFMFFKQIILALYNVFLSFGINSRTLSLFLRDDIHLSGRDIISEKVIPEILQRPILGIGLAGDRRIFGGSYVHNFFIEIVGNFGLILGGVAIVLLLLLVIKSLFIKDRNNYSLVIMWMSMGFVPLMVSSSYLINMKFWIFLGIMINFTRRSRAQQVRKYYNLESLDS